MLFGARLTQSARYSSQGAHIAGYGRWIRNDWGGVWNQRDKQASIFNMCDVCSFASDTSALFSSCCCAGWLKANFKEYGCGNGARNTYILVDIEMNSNAVAHMPSPHILYSTDTYTPINRREYDVAFPVRNGCRSFSTFSMCLCWTYISCS